MIPQNEYLSMLIKNARKTNAEQFIQLVSESTDQLKKEIGYAEFWQVVGRFVKMSYKGTLIIVSDIHGDLESLVHILEDSGFLETIKKSRDIFLVFLGDYGDRGAYSVDVYYIILKLKEQFPNNVVLMRGNHEGPEDLLVSPHDLPYQLHANFGKKGQKAYSKMKELFNHLYTAVLVKGKFIMLHGGIPSQATSLNDLAYAHNTHPKESHLEEMLWNDPDDEINGTYPSPRGAGKLFGENVSEKFLKIANAKVLIRGHEPCEDGFRINHHNKVLTLFSRKGEPYFNSHGAYLQLDSSIEIENVTSLLPYIRSF